MTIGEHAHSIALGVLAILALLAIMHCPSGAGEDLTAHPFHMNLKDDWELNPRTQPDERNTVTEQLVKSYTNNGILLQRDWEPVGEWEAEPLTFDVTVESQVTFNIWFANLEAGDSADDSQTEFRWHLKLNDLEIATADSESTDANERTQVDATASMDETELATGDILSLEIEYRAFDEVEIYYDSPDNHSGLYLEGAAIVPLAIHGEGRELIVTFAETFESELGEALANDWIMVRVNGTALSGNTASLTRTTVRVNVSNAEIYPLEITWLYHGPPGEYLVEVSLSYYPTAGASGSNRIEPWTINDTLWLPKLVIESITPNPVVQGGDVNFSAYAAQSFTRYTWSSDKDGEFSNSTNTSTVYSGLSYGRHTITLGGLGPDGNWSYIQTTLLVLSPPTAQAGDNVTVATGDTIQFHGEGADLDGVIILWEWDLDGDGVYDESSSSDGLTTYIFHAPGTYEAVLKVTDDDGLTATDTRVIQIEEEDDDEEESPSTTPVTFLASLGLMGYLTRRWRD